MNEKSPTSSTASRLILGFLVAPAIPPALICAAGFVAAPHDAFGTLWSGMLIAMISYTAAIGLGGPCYLILQAKKISTLRAYVLSGAGIGTGFSIAFALMNFVGLLAFGWGAIVAGGSVLLGNAIRTTSLAAVMGALSSAAFWAISVRNSER